MFLTMDNFDFNNKSVVVRVDINCPLDPDSGEILDDKRIREVCDTLKELINSEAKVTILAHQSRPGKKDFTSLSEHCKVLSEHLNHEVEFIDELFSRRVRERILNLEPGEAIMLENVRFSSEEVLSDWKKWEGITPKKQGETYFIKKLAPLFNYFINDAFPAAHRAQPSLVGFSYYMPAIAGRLMEKEIKVLSKVRDDPENPCVYSLGGAKADDSIKIMMNVIEKVDKILTSGVVGNIFLIAKGYDLGRENKEIIKNLGLEGEIEKAKKLLEKYGEKILTPVDLALEVDGERVERKVTEKIDKPAYDIGSETIEIYSEVLKEAKTIVANGPAGVFEKEKFSYGTRKLLEAMANSKAFTVIGGGHLSAVAELYGFSDKIDHISTGGGSTLSFLSGERLPVIEVLKMSYEKY
ncbi:Phosphoglycerate kinase [Methanocaldococcus infernus ME]|uniref:Phosphoglycerate kinase n=1 Tax=Methanocaldococcus infernus (strain DSM 11812 / JCM 15783 / ME) TaxID=573063 RepID=D5VR86_METIM|nr:phosphoglycerate kinase [Methanocaldococcus infernus]ADG13089.1 Phosphoglycerate kinase [Methanocaldococcus infernus ME]